MDKFTIEQIGKAKENHVFDGLSDDLKDPKNFEGIEKKIANTMVSDHKHKVVSTFIKCKRCQTKVAKKSEMIRELGFKDMNQYQNWRKVMNIVINKGELILYEKK